MGFGEFLAFAFEVEDLATDEAAAAGGVCEFGDVFADSVGAGGFGGGEDGECFGEKGIAC